MPQGNGWWSFAWQGGREDRWRRPDLASDQKPKWSRAWHGRKLEAQLRRQGHVRIGNVVSNTTMRKFTNSYTNNTKKS